MTAGYCFGDNIWICWLHVLYDRILWGVVARTGQKMQALPRLAPLPLPDVPEKDA